MASQLGKRGATCVSFLATELRRKAESKRTMGDIVSQGHNQTQASRFQEEFTQSNMGASSQVQGSRLSWVWL